MHMHHRLRTLHRQPCQVVEPSSQALNPRECARCQLAKLFCCRARLLCCAGRKARTVLQRLVRAILRRFNKFNLRVTIARSHSVWINASGCV